MPSDRPLVHLARSEPDAYDAEAVVDAVTAAGGERAGLDGVLADLSRRGRRTLAPHPRLLGLAVDRALTWDATDRRDRDWWPQGITHSERTGTTRPLLLVSWYHRGEAGARVSVLDPATRRYQHVLLAEPVRAGDHAGSGVALRPLRVHAGGLVWHRRHLHVAATARGFFTASLDDVLRVPGGGRAGEGVLGLDPAGHAYVLPVRHAFRAGYAEGTEPLRYSFLSLDRSGTPPELLVGEYGRAGQSRRFARFEVDDATGLPAYSPDGQSVSPEDGGELRMQGVAAADGAHYVTASDGPWRPGTVYVGRPGALRGRRWATPMGPEDLTWWPATGMLWTATEHPRRRWVVGMRKDRLDRWAERVRRDDPRGGTR
ncbi:hypothetical protein [Nocardioides sp. YIM 152588]|uniref:hypothetical protein n=1 Tax=Nocardioides sp. YIM 152588 TaxID=3158259 RepID=UPI0032E44652